MDPHDYQRQWMCSYDVPAVNESLFCSLPVQDSISNFGKQFNFENPEMATGPRPSVPTTSTMPRMSSTTTMRHAKSRIPQRPTPTVQYLNSMFHEQTEEEDNAKLSQQLLKLARKSGTLNLSSRGLGQVPEKVYRINEADDDKIEVKLEKMNDDDAWWNQVPLSNLDLSSNSLTQLSPKIENLQSLTVLTLHDNALETLPPEIGKLEKLMRLNLSRNKLSVLPRQLFTLPELRHLNLSYNSLNELDPDISDLHMLEFLDASHNNIENVPGGIGFLVRLTALLLQHNHIKDLPDDFVNMRSLQKLDLMHNDLTELPEDIGLLRKLQCLYVQHNDVVRLPTFEGCEALQELHASNNYIKEVNKRFCSNLSHLKILDLRDNKIELLPDEICLLRNLVRLDISNNSLTNLPVSLSSLAHLVSLQVDGNPIKSIRRDILQCGTTRILKTLQDRAQAAGNKRDINPEDATSATTKMVGDGLNSPRLQGGTSPDASIYPDKYKLRHTRTLAVNMEKLTTVPNEVFEIASSEQVSVVDFSRNHLSTLPEGLQMLNNGVSELVFANNDIVRVPPFISQFTRVTLINLSCNHLNDLPREFGVLNTLRELNIANNRFEHLPAAIYELQGLEVLIASDNRIKFIDASDQGLGAMKRLATVDLRNNNINHVPPILGNLTNITALELIGNPFRQPRHQVIVKGTDAIMSYLRDRIPN